MCGDTVCNRWRMCRCRTVSVHSLAPSSWMSNISTGCSRRPRPPAASKSSALVTAYLVAALGNRSVPRRVERDDLLDGRRLSFLEVERGWWSTKPGSLTRLLRIGRRAVAPQPGPCRQGDPHAGLECLGLEVDRLGVDLGLVEHGQVAGVQVVVALDPGVDHAAIEAGP